MMNSKKKSDKKLYKIIFDKIERVFSIYKARTLSLSTIIRKTGLLLLFVLLISALYWTATEINSPFFDEANEVSASDTSKTILITADGLITTSTFAFVAFISISPSSSGSTVSINKLGWKGPYVLRYSILLIISVLLTSISLIFNDAFSQFLLYSALISSLILIIIICKYVYYNNDSSTKSTSVLIRIMKDYSNRGKTITVLRNKVTRPYLNPMKGSHNVDFMRALLADKDVYESLRAHLPKVYGSYKEFQKALNDWFIKLVEDSVKPNSIKSTINSNISFPGLLDSTTHPLLSEKKFNTTNPDDNLIDNFFGSKIIDIISYGSWTNQEIAYMLSSMINKHEKQDRYSTLESFIENLKLSEDNIKEIKEKSKMILGNMSIKNTED